MGPLTRASCSRVIRSTLAEADKPECAEIRTLTVGPHPPDVPDAIPFCFSWFLAALSLPLQSLVWRARRNETFMIRPAPQREKERLRHGGQRDRHRTRTRRADQRMGHASGIETDASGSPSADPLPTTRQRQV